MQMSYMLPFCDWTYSSSTGGTSTWLRDQVPLLLCLASPPGVPLLPRSESERTRKGSPEMVGCFFDHEEAQTP